MLELDTHPREVSAPARPVAPANGQAARPPAGANVPGLPVPLDFSVPPSLEASRPPEVCGLARDEVKLMVLHRAGGEITHTRFKHLPDFLVPGDELVINTSGTLAAALPAVRRDGMPLELHLSTHLPNGRWSLELRRLEGEKNYPFASARPGEVLYLPGGAKARLLHPLGRPGQEPPQEGSGPVRLWEADLELPQPLESYLRQHGSPIRYSYVEGTWPLRYYQTVYATRPGSVEMPSAGRAFTPELITHLVAGGVLFAPLLLHTGVASLEEHEPPYEEYYQVPEMTARVVNAARQEGRRVIAVGTTSVRALETAANRRGVLRASEGWTDLVITPQRGLRVVNGLLTGLHEPRSSHLALLAALCSLEQLRVSYEAALEQGYLWHEFGDLQLILP